MADVVPMLVMPHLNDKRGREKRRHIASTFLTPLKNGERRTRETPLTQLTEMVAAVEGVCPRGLQWKSPTGYRRD